MRTYSTILLILVLTPICQCDDWAITTGKQCRITSDAVMATNFIWYHRMTELAEAGDTLGAQQMVSKGYIVFATEEMDALIIKTGRGYVEARITSGKYKGESYYIPTVYLKRPLTLEERIERKKAQEAADGARKVATEEAERAAKERQEKRQKGVAEWQERVKQDETDVKKMREKDKIEKQLAADEKRAGELLRFALYWRDDQKDDQKALERITELRRRFPNSKAASESIKLFPSQNKK